MVGVARLIRAASASWSRIEITNINNNTFKHESVATLTFEGVFLLFGINRN